MYLKSMNVTMLFKEPFHKFFETFAGITRSGLNDSKMRCPVCITAAEEGLSAVQGADREHCNNV